MAHKTFSQKQIYYKFYKILIKYSININNIKLSYQKNQSKYFFLKTREKISANTVSTNFFLQKKISIKYKTYETGFFKMNLHDEIGRHARLKTLSFI